jgi:hypothetical protein
MKAAGDKQLKDCLDQQAQQSQQSNSEHGDTNNDGY